MHDEQKSSGDEPKMDTLQNNAHLSHHKKMALLSHFSCLRVLPHY